jgi:hypothetical protein
MRSRQELIIEGLKTIHVNEAYGQYGKYTGWISRYIDTMIEKVNSTEFHDISVTVPVKVTADKNSFYVMVEDDYYAVGLDWTKVRYEGNVVLDPKRAGTGKCRLCTIDVEDDIIKVRNEYLPIGDLSDRLFVKSVTVLILANVFIKKTKGLSARGNFFGKTWRYSSPEEFRDFIGGVFDDMTGVDFEVRVCKEEGTNMVVRGYIKIPFEDDLDMANAWDAKYSATKKYLDMVNRFSKLGISKSLAMTYVIDEKSVY